MQKKNIVEARLELEANKILNMLTAKRYLRLQRYLEDNKTEIYLFPIDQVNFILDWCLTLEADPKHLSFIFENVPHDLLIDALNYNNGHILESFIANESFIEGMTKKPYPDYRKVRIEKILLLLSLDENYVTHGLERLALECPNLHITSEVEIDFKTARQVYNNSKTLKEKNFNMVPLEVFKLPIKRTFDRENSDGAVKKKFKH